MPTDAYRIRWARYLDRFDRKVKGCIAERWIGIGPVGYWCSVSGCYRGTEEQAQQDIDADIAWRSPLPPTKVIEG